MPCALRKSGSRSSSSLFLSTAFRCSPFCPPLPALPVRRWAAGLAPPPPPPPPLPLPRPPVGCTGTAALSSTPPLPLPLPPPESPMIRARARWYSCSLSCTDLYAMGSTVESMNSLCLSTLQCMLSSGGSISKRWIGMVWGLL